MTTLDWIDIAGLCIIGFNCIVVSPLSIACTIRISRHKREPHFHKRYVFLLMGIVIFALLYITIDRSFYIAMNVLQFIDINKILHLDKLPQNIEPVIEAILACSSMLICLLCFMERTWLLFYDHNYNMGRSDVWRRNVGSIIERDSQSWFQINKKTLGKSSFLRKLIVIIWLISSGIIICTVYFSPNTIIVDIIFCAFLFIFVCFMIYLVNGIQSEWDFVFIRVELIWDLIFVLFGTISFIVISSMFKDRLQYLLTSFTTICSIYGLLFMSIGFPLISWSSKNKKDRTMSNVMPNRQSRVLPMETVLKDAESFELFMLHLVKEWSVENLLFICDLMQFKEHLQGAILKPCTEPFELTRAASSDDTIVSMTMEDPDVTLFIMELPMDIIPKSSCIKHSESYLSAARNIYNKYVCKGCELEINISSATRRELYDFFHVMYPHNPEELKTPCQELQRHATNSVISPGTMEVIRNSMLMNNKSQSAEEKALKTIMMDGNEDLEQMVVELEQQYSSEKQINCELKMAFDGPSELDIFSVFDHAKNEILSILKDSYQRFSRSTEYKEIVEPKILKQHQKRKSQSLKKIVITGAKMIGKRFSEKHSKPKLGIDLNGSQLTVGSDMNSNRGYTPSPTTPSDNVSLDINT